MIGKMRERLEIQRQYIETDKTGNKVVQWLDYYKCWGEVKPLKGSRINEFGSVSADNPLMVVIRFKDGKELGVSNRVLMRSSIYQVQAVVELDFNRHFYELHLKELKHEVTGF